MKNTVKSNDLIIDQTRLFIKFNRAAAFLSLLLALLCIFILKTDSVLPLVFFIYGLINLFNIFLIKKLGRVTVLAILMIMASLISTFVISLFSGGIESPFIFVFAIIILAGYITASSLGKIYAYTVLAIVAFIFTMDFMGLIPYNTVPQQGQKLFSFVTVLFSMYILGAVFGRTLLKTHHTLYKSKRENEQRINEKEILLKEVHHRVKNNLQTVSSLLNMQVRESTDKQTKDIIKSSQNRVVSMAKIHEMLYMHKDLSKIEFKPYVQGLCKYLVQSFNPGQNNISLDMDIPNIQLGIDTAIPLGLLINEAITNSLKYGFAEGERGRIEIDLKKEPYFGSYILKIGDNGVGLSKDVDPKEIQSLGLKLILKLARQLKGSVAMDDSKKGTHYIIAFQDIDIKAKQVA